jgi:hypothetical protein
MMEPDHYNVAIQTTLEDQEAPSFVMPGRHSDACQLGSCGWKMVTTTEILADYPHHFRKHDG